MDCTRLYKLTSTEHISFGQDLKLLNSQNQNYLDKNLHLNSSIYFINGLGGNGKPNYRYYILFIG